MITANSVHGLLNSDLFRSQYEYSNHELAAALPDPSLQFLLSICRALGVKNIFEFGSGRSTKALLAQGYHVTSLEDSSYWLNQTTATLTEEEKEKHKSFVKPLALRFIGLFPVLDWQIDSEIKKDLEQADLILVDSPYYTPFRESTLWSALNFSENAVIILDDTRIPTLSRFCDRLSLVNHAMHARVKVGHGFDMFYLQNSKKLHLKHSAADTIKGWYRFFQGLNFYRKLSRQKLPGA
jgi:hypothetical protein